MNLTILFPFLEHYGQGEKKKKKHSCKHMEMHTMPRISFVITMSTHKFLKGIDGIN